MIKYQLRCDTNHEFEGWFRNSADFDAQADGGLLQCPACGSTKIEKAIMAPSISTGSEAREKRLSDMRRNIVDAARRAREYVEKNFEYVGERFPEEARQIHYGEKQARGIYGEATGSEVKELIDEGVAVAPLPGPPNTDTASEPVNAARGCEKKTLN